MYINQHVLSGNVGADATLRNVNGKSVLNFRMGHTSPFGEKRTTWYSVSVWGPQAETLAPMIVTGTRVVAVGSSDAREFTDKNGNARVSQEFNATSVQLVDRKADREASAVGAGDDSVEGDPFSF